MSVTAKHACLCYWFVSVCSLHAGNFRIPCYNYTCAVEFSIGIGILIFGMVV